MTLQLPMLMLLAATCAAAPKVVAIAHRGEHLHHPENTLPAYQAAIDAGADFIEIDLRTTKDGKFVIMHDSKVDRMTNGTGAVKDMTFDEIRALDAGVKFSPDFKGTKVPTFDEVLELARGKIGIYLDTKDAQAAAVIAELEKYEMQDHVVVYGGYQYLKDVHALRPNIKVMPESVSAALLARTLKEFQPRVVAFSERDWKDDIIALAKQANADIYVDRLGDADNPEHWQDAITRGATGIQSNRPAELVQYLRSKGYHN